ncbi:MAG TPA: AI-2E family transporter [Bacteroidetes bacterium]|nr:AI-2E family transporter [Bacteroidota bacterium]
MKTINKQKTSSVLWILASLVIVLAGIKVASNIIVPFLMALFIVIIFKPFANALQKKGVPGWLSLAVILLFILVFIGLLVTMITVSVQNFSDRIPFYNEKLIIYRDQLIMLSQKFGMHIDQQQLNNFFDPAKIMGFVGIALKSFSDILSNGLLILLTIVFIFIESNIFNAKLKFIARDEKKLKYIHEINEQLNHYMLIKSITSASTGIILGGALAIAGIDYALLWGVVAFMLNYIPSIGSLIAAIPPIILTLVQFGLPESIAVTLLYVAINFLIGSVIEPRVMGRGLGLSVLIVFLSLIFWGWILGPVGMFLSIPITLVIKIILHSQPETRWISIILGNGIELRSIKRQQLSNS